ncbi:MAG TPA: nucleotide exchange factor GrpE [Stellaceae bacterium]|nr:nucleotide exchange factor GrpE [Stellaceae bacterium]
MTDENDGASGASETVPTSGHNAEERVAALEAELAEARDKLLRALAETENVRRRGQREREDAQRYSVQNFARDMVTVADNLRRALDSVPAGAEDGPASGLLAGVAATERELLAALDRHGVKRVEPQPGDRFDHNLHEAMFEVDAPGQPGGTIVQVLQPGYLIHDRLLRPAMVGVAKASGEPRPRVDEVV